MFEEDGVKVELSPSSRVAIMAGDIGDFAALFATLDQPLEQSLAQTGYTLLLSRVASPSFQISLTDLCD